MATFRFYQDKEVKTWVRDYYEVEADSLEDAIDFIQKEGTNMEQLEYKYPDRVSFDERDDDQMFDLMEDQDPTNFEIYPCDDVYQE